MSAQRFALVAGVCLLTVLSAGRLRAATVTLAGADAQGLKFTTDVEAATLRIPIETDADVKELSVGVDDFVGPGGILAPATLTLGDAPLKGPIALKQLERPVLELRAAFREAGEYRSNIVLTYDGTRTPSVALVVTRVKNVGTIKIEVGGAVDASSFRGGSAAVRFVLQETAGKPVAVDPPRLINLSRKIGDKNLKQAQHTSITLTAMDEALTPILSIEKWGRREFVMNVDGLRDAGEYSALLRVTSRDAAPVNEPVTLYVKKSAWLAFIFIFLGVGASWLFRRWVKEQKPRLESLRRLEDSEDDLKTVTAAAGTLSTDEARAVAALRTAMSKVRREVERSTKDVAATLDGIDRKVAALPRWITLGRKIDAASKAVDVTRVRSQWQALVETYFAIAAAPDDPFNTAMTTIANDLDAATKEQVLRTIREFQQTVDAARTADPARAPALDAAVKPLMDDARAKADAGKLPEARTTLVDAKAAYVKVMVDRVTQELQSTPPVGFTSAEWQDLQTQLKPLVRDVKSQTDPDRAIVAFTTLNTSFLRELVAGAERRLTSAKADLAQSGTIPPDQKKELTTLLELTTTPALRKAAAAVDLGNLDDAAKVYREAVEQLARVDKAISGSGGGSLAVPGALTRVAEFILGPAATPLFGALPADFPDLPARTPTPAGRLSEIIERYDTLLNIGLLIIATVLGMSLLWFNNPVWGGWDSYSTAFLWGLGLHQVGGAGFEGLPAITKKLTE